MLQQVHKHILYITLAVAYNFCFVHENFASKTRFSAAIVFHDTFAMVFAWCIISGFPSDALCINKVLSQDVFYACTMTNTRFVPVVHTLSKHIFTAFCSEKEMNSV